MRKMSTRRERKSCCCDGFWQASPHTHSKRKPRCGVVVQFRMDAIALRTDTVVHLDRLTRSHPCIMVCHLTSRSDKTCTIERECQCAHMAHTLVWHRTAHTRTRTQVIQIRMVALRWVFECVCACSSQKRENSHSGRALSSSVASVQVSRSSSSSFDCVRHSV